MKKKDVNRLLKGVAGVGIALGGANILQDESVVYAYDSEADENSGLDLTVETLD